MSDRTPYEREKAEQEAADRAYERWIGYHLPDPVQEAGRRDYEFEVALARTPYRPDPVSEELASLRAIELEEEREREEWIYEQEEW